MEHFRSLKICETDTKYCRFQDVASGGGAQVECVTHMISCILAWSMPGKRMERFAVIWARQAW